MTQHHEPYRLPNGMTIHCGCEDCIAKYEDSYLGDSDAVDRMMRGEDEDEDEDED